MKKRKIFSAFIIVYIIISALFIHTHAGNITTNDIYRFLNTASETAGWFNGSSYNGIEYIDDNILVGNDGIEFAPVKGEMNTFEKLQNKIESVFSRDLFSLELKDGYVNPITDMRHSTSFFVSEGTLYYRKDFNHTAQRIQDIYSESNSTVEIIKDNGTVLEFLFTASFFDMGKTRSYVYKMVKTDDTYVFTDFVLPTEIKSQTNPRSSDSAVYITAAAGVIALCCALIINKKIKTQGE